ncbi:MAG: phenylalanine--tRNA ligase subunit beta, partial [Sulfurimonas sp.]
MIVTKHWLNEWIPLEAITTEQLLATLNAIGLEVDRHEHFSVPEHIVVGKVLSCDKHPDATKLSVCQVDTGSAVQQIVCGASNVREGLYVAVATVGAQMPSGMEIKPLKLRGVASEGMLCSAGEIGLPALNEGILELDESIGTLALGTPLCENRYFNDDLIEIELTANRGDCLSIHGICRDLCAAYNIEFREQQQQRRSDNGKGVGRLIHLVHEERLDVDVCYSALELSSIQLPLVVQLRLALIEVQHKSDLEALLFYATYNSGVILRAYCKEFFDNSEGIAQLRLTRDDAGFSVLYGQTEYASVVGVHQNRVSMCTQHQGTVIVEASYIAPDTVSKLMHQNPRASDEFYYRTSRGTETDLEFGLVTVLDLLKRYCDVSFYRGALELSQQRKPCIVAMTRDEITALIGNDVKKTQIVQILQRL